MPDEEFRKGYRKGYADGFRDAVNDAIEQAVKGLKPQEMKLMLRSSLTTVDRRADARLGGVKDAPVLEVKAKTEVEIQREELSLGCSYIVKESKVEKGLSIFSWIAEERKGLCIVRTNPQALKPVLGKENISLYWLTASEKDANRKEFGFISPTDLPTLASVVIEFLRKDNGSAVLLQGIEYLISQNSFSAVLKMVQKINDAVVMNNSVLLLSLNPAGMDEKEYNNLAKEMTREI